MKNYDFIMECIVLDLREKLSTYVFFLDVKPILENSKITTHEVHFLFRNDHWTIHVAKFDEDKERFSNHLFAVVSRDFEQGKRLSFRLRIVEKDGTKGTRDYLISPGSLRLMPFSYISQENDKHVCFTENANNISLKISQKVTK